ncbi:MAG: hypothetical protein COU30_02350 [Candidatus Magasanikbacteria bacterium CG10_big_fil_rev_8_21_14_0_10_38_6]|uniref:Uncharacterized protein n=1 Tax=Candidatus Magasanikbacteria bacterium CG10_big_fil_rev_8_21_14_0_10_38_6 TaxID=1974647 RepID=A0A2M6P183_9BACT|nr:MAG: hypothetical protein COU30_02350 [Candidatus Magasanikbacteria bacterium CG10_big_fil_rev_8_21_14_0_10_38_6]
MIDGKYAQVIFQDNVNQGLTSMKIRFLDSPDKLVELASENLREYDFVRAPMRHQAAGYLVEDGLMEEEMLDNLHYTASENDRDSKRMINFFGTYTKNK